VALSFFGRTSWFTFRLFSTKCTPVGVDGDFLGKAEWSFTVDPSIMNIPVTNSAGFRTFWLLLSYRLALRVVSLCVSQELLLEDSVQQLQ
jgi:hypothetical protein